MQQPGAREPIVVFGSAATAVADDADLADYKMLFSLADVGEVGAGGVFSKWLDISQRLRDVCVPYFAIQHKPDSYLELQYLAVFQAMEAYQRIRIGAEHDVPDSESLRARVRDLLAHHWPIVEPLFQASLEISADSMVAARNFVVHRLPSFAAASDQARELFWLTQKAMFVMKAVFLSELGLGESDRQRLIKRNQMYTRILRASQSLA